MPAKVLILLFAAVAGTTSSGNLNRCRQLYSHASTNEDSAKLLQKLSKHGTANIEKAYFAASKAFMAKHSSNPFTKLSLLKESLKGLNTIIASDGKDIETRFLRFSIEDNIPSFISFESHLSSDKEYIVKNIQKSHPMYATIKSYMKACKRLSSTEKKKFD